jgi:hypothetical protein
MQPLHLTENKNVGGSYHTVSDRLLSNHISQYQVNSLNPFLKNIMNHSEEMLNHQYIKRH